MITEKDIGRRVIVNGRINGEEFKNETGRIVTVMPDGFPRIGVEFGMARKEFHSCEGTAGENSGWYVYEKNITFEKESKEMTGIRIETEKIVEGNGNLSRKITGFKALKRGNLPDLYLYGTRPICFINGENNLCVQNREPEFSDTYFKINEIVPEKTFQKLLTHCHAAGDHLMDVNRELREKRAMWNGKETFII